MALICQLKVHAVEHLIYTPETISVNFPFEIVSVVVICALILLTWHKSKISYDHKATILNWRLPKNLIRGVCACCARKIRVTFNIGW